MMYPFAILLLFIFVGIPMILTVLNIVLLFREKSFKRKTVNVIDILIFFLGISYTVLLALVTEFHEWSEQLYFIGGSEKYTAGGTYTPVSFEYFPTFIFLCVISVAAHLLLRFLSKRLSPIIASVCYGGIFLGLCLTVMLTIQFSCDITNGGTILFLLFPYNYVLCSIRLIRNTVFKYTEKIANTSYDNKILRMCKAFLSKSSAFITVSFFTAIPLLIVVIIILTLFGQQPDSAIKMFTETAEWTLSQKIPPPRLDYDGHYLCTVAACGDEKVVKPLRAGKRNNQLIIVNRQILVANAFEDLIAEKTPKLHKIIRKSYDKFGLPISRHIVTKRRSNIVYYIMKPLEWFFVLVLYTFDTNPENRIHIQYLR